MAVRPPHSAEEWSIWQDACIQTNRRDLLPKDLRIRRWPEGFPSGIGWTPVAQDHPFAGSHFCWRCVAEASGLAGCEVVPHRRAGHVICWGPAEGDEAPGDPEQDSGPAEPPTGGSDRIITASRFQPESTDTGNLFWPPPGWSQYGQPPKHPAAPEALQRIREGLGLEGITPDALPPVPRPMGTWRVEDGRIVTEDFADTWPPSWTDDASALESLPADFREWSLFDHSQLVEADAAEDEDRQPGPDEAP